MCVRLLRHGANAQNTRPVIPIPSFCVRAFTFWRASALPLWICSRRSSMRRCRLRLPRRYTILRGSVHDSSDEPQMQCVSTSGRATLRRISHCVRSTRAMCSLTATICRPHVQRTRGRQRNTVRSFRMCAHLTMVRTAGENGCGLGISRPMSESTWCSPFRMR